MGSARGDVGYGSALSLIFFVIVLTFTLIQRDFFASGTAEGTPWGQIMAYTSLITIPVIVVFLVFQRAFLSSVASSGVKG